MKMTLSKLAKLCNVSVSTASKAFSGSPDINEDTRKMIFSVAREHNCFDEFFSARYPRPVVAVFCPEFASGYYSQYLRCLEKYFSAKNIKMSVSITEFSEETLRSLLEYYSCYVKVSGIILLGQSPIPVKSLPAVEIINSKKIQMAIDEAVKTLKTFGHKKIGYIGEPLCGGKFEGIKNALAKNGLQIEEKFIIEDAARMEIGGYEAAKSLMKKGELPTALFFSYDQMAIGAMRAFSESGIKIPEDISICSFDDIPECEYLVPSLSSIGVDFDEASFLTSELLIKMMKEKSKGVVEFATESRFIKRESIGKAKE